tara:strand:- start:415 stop:597 length:183 start_codon:yes stop_codon:yes gene_type:complete
LKKEKIVNKLRKYVSYALTVGGLAHFIEFGFAIYEQAFLTSTITLLFGCLDLLAAYIIKE